MTKSNLPKILPGQQVRFRHRPTGLFFFKPKGSYSSNGRLDEKKFSLWRNYAGMSALKYFVDIHQFDGKKQRWYSNPEYAGIKLEDFDIEVVALNPMFTIPANKYYEGETK